MVEVVELGSGLSKADYNAHVPELRPELRQAPFLVIVLFGGVDAAGREGAVEFRPDRTGVRHR
tara:strand:- start:681 stop:869 length:189 start_codon:yes stop_codon:yes gene_type:complete